MNLDKIKQDISATESIKLITEVLANASATKIRNTRKSIEHNLNYFRQLTNVYRTVKKIALAKKLIQPRDKTKNGKTMILLLTSNNRFYGGLDTDLVKYYKAKTADLTVDRIVIGRQGNSLLQSFNYNQPYQYINLEKDIPDFSQIQMLSEKVFHYSQILIFHTKFVTLLNQTPTVTDITESNLSPEIVDKSLVYYITEPEADKILTFFETQVLLLLFQSVFLEVEIARTAARMISMNQAEENATKQLTEIKKQFLKIRKQYINTQIIENFSRLMQPTINKD